MTKLAEAPVATVPARTPSPFRCTYFYGYWCVASWSVTFVAHALSVDWSLPPLILVATASLLRIGRSLTDRIVLSMVLLLLGATAVAGLLFSVWPFGFHPVVLAGTTMTALGLTSLVLRRRPSLPKFGFGDMVTLGATALVLLYLARPLITTDQIGMFSMVRGGWRGQQSPPRHVRCRQARRWLSVLPHARGVT